MLCSLFLHCSLCSWAQEQCCYTIKSLIKSVTPRWAGERVELLLSVELFSLPVDSSALQDLRERAAGNDGSGPAWTGVSPTSTPDWKSHIRRIWRHLLARFKMPVAVWGELQLLWHCTLQPLAEQVVPAFSAVFSSKAALGQLCGTEALAPFLSGLYQEQIFFQISNSSNTQMLLLTGLKFVPVTTGIRVIDIARLLLG